MGQISTEQNHITRRELLNAIAYKAQTMTLLYVNDFILTVEMPRISETIIIVMPSLDRIRLDIGNFSFIIGRRIYSAKFNSHTKIRKDNRNATAYMQKSAYILQRSIYRSIIFARIFAVNNQLNY